MARNVPVQEIRQEPGSFRRQASNMSSENLMASHIEKLTSNNDTKDKTQVAATTSMTVIHIGILRVLLNTDPDRVSYYNFCLGVVIAALVLQFIAGVLAIYIAMMKSFLTHFHGDFGYYLRSRLCPCLKDSRRDMLIHTRARSDEETQRLLENHSDLVKPRGLQRTTSKYRTEIQETQDYEDMLLERYSSWKNDNFDVQRTLDKVLTKISTTMNHLKELNKQLKMEGSDESDSSDQTKTELQNQLKKHERDLIALEEENMDLQARHQEGVILRRELKTILDHKVQIKVALWQCMFTVLTYLVFAANALITGFGLANITSL